MNERVLLLLGLAVAGCGTHYGPEDLTFREHCDGWSIANCDVREEACQTRLHDFVACTLERDAGPRPLVRTATALSPADAARQVADCSWPEGLRPALALAEIYQPLLVPTSPDTVRVTLLEDPQEIVLAAADHARVRWFDDAANTPLALGFTAALQNQEQPSAERFAAVGTAIDRCEALSAVLQGEGHLAAEFRRAAVDRYSVWEVDGLTDLFGEPAVSWKDDRLALPYVMQAWKRGQTTAVREALASPPSTRALVDAALRLASPTTGTPPIPAYLLNVAEGFETDGDTEIGELRFRIFGNRFAVELSEQVSLYGLDRDRFWSLKRGDDRCFVWALVGPRFSDWFQGHVGTTRPLWRVIGDGRSSVFWGCSDPALLASWDAPAAELLQNLARR